MHSRQTSRTTNFSKSMGPGSRPPVSGVRPPMPTNFGQPAGNRPRAATRTRPATAMGDDHGRDDDEGPTQQPQQQQQQQQPNGTSFLPLSQIQTPNRKLRDRKTHGPAFLQSSTKKPREVRDVSGLSRIMRNLSLDDDDPYSKSDGVRVFSKDIQISFCASQSDARREGAFQRPCQKEGVRQFQSRSGTAQTTPMTRPTTPPPQQDAEAAMDKFKSTVDSIIRTPASPAKSCSPVKFPFLTKDSNVTLFAGWNVDERLLEVESQFKEMKEALSGSLTDKKAMEEAVQLAKSRGRSSF